MDAFGFAQIAEPKRRQREQLEFILVEVGAGGDLEGAAVMLCAANDDQGCVQRLFFGFDAEARKLVSVDFSCALPPIRKNTEARLQIQIDGVSNLGVRAGAGDAQKVATLFWFVKRSGQAERQLANFSANKLLRSARDVPGKIELLCQHVGGARGKKRQSDAMAFLRGS